MARFRPVKTSILLAVSLGLALAACVSKEAREPPAKTPPVLAGVPVVPGSQVIDTAGTAEAARIVLVVAQPPESVAAYYRRELPKAGFRVIGDVGDSLRVDLYAQRDGPPLWVQVKRGRRPGTTEYAIIGAVGEPAGSGDTAARDTLRRGVLR
jgi:hypothetical protein